MCYSRAISTAGERAALSLNFRCFLMLPFMLSHLFPGIGSMMKWTLDAVVCPSVRSDAVMVDVRFREFFGSCSNPTKYSDGWTWYGDRVSTRLFSTVSAASCMRCAICGCGRRVTTLSVLSMVAHTTRKVFDHKTTSTKLFPRVCKSVTSST